MCLSIFGRLGIDVNLIPYFTHETNRQDSGLFFKVLIKAIILSSFLALVIFLLKEVISINLFKKPQLEAYMIWTALTIPFWTIILVCAGLFRALKKNTLIAFFNKPGMLLATLAISLLLVICCKVDLLLAIKAHIYGVLIIAIVIIYLLLKQSEKISVISHSISWLFLKEAYPMMFSGAIIVFL